MDLKITLTKTETLVFVTAVRSVATVFKDIIGDHPVAPKLQQEIDESWSRFGDLFRKSVDLYHQVLIDDPANPPSFVPSRPRLWEQPPQAIDHSAVTEPVLLGEGHYYEMMDRTSCMNLIYDSLIVKHSVAQLFPKEIDVLGELLAGLYQDAARLHYDFLKK